MISLASEIVALLRAHKKHQRELMLGPLRVMVRKGDSNPHGIATASPSSWSIYCAVAN